MTLKLLFIDQSYKYFPKWSAKKALKSVNGESIASEPYFSVNEYSRNSPIIPNKFGTFHNSIAKFLLLNSQSSLDPVFHKLSFGIKFISYIIWNYSGIPGKYYFQLSRYVLSHIVYGITGGVARSGIIGQLPTNLKGIAQAFFWNAINRPTPMHRRQSH